MNANSYWYMAATGGMIGLSVFLGEEYDRNLSEFNLVCGGLVETISEILGSTTCDDARKRLAILLIFRYTAIFMALLFFIAGIRAGSSGGEPSGDELSHLRHEFFYNNEKKKALAEAARLKKIANAEEKTSNIHQDTDSNIIKKEANFCTGCGSKRKPSAKFCFNCGKEY